MPSVELTGVYVVDRGLVRRVALSYGYVDRPEYRHRARSAMDFVQHKGCCLSNCAFAVRIVRVDRFGV